MYSLNIKLYIDMPFLGLLFLLFFPHVLYTKGNVKRCVEEDGN